MTDSRVTSTPLADLYGRLNEGTIGRREFISRALALGVASGAVLYLANTVSAQDASADSNASGERPTNGTEGQERGAGGELNIIQWQAPTQLSPHVSTGVKDRLAACMIMEPLMHYLPDASMIPNLITEVPTVENGLLAEDLTSVTFNLIPDVLWSDGEPFTAADIQATVDWVKNPESNSPSFSMFEAIESVEVVDDLTAKVSFHQGNPFWYDSFAGTDTGYVYPKHILDQGPEAHEALLSSPIGTGPYRVESFSPGDSANLVINEHYREPNKPFFAKVNLKGGGDAASAARAVLQTGDADFAWNLQVEPDVLSQMDQDDAPGIIMKYPGVAVEKVNINFSDPNTEVDGQRSEVNTPNPVLSDYAVRQAMSLAIDRDLIASSFFGYGQDAARNVLYGDAAIESPNTTYTLDPDEAVRVLDEAGWALDGDVRKKDGISLKLTLASTVNSVRQKTQALIKARLEEIGFQIEIVTVDPGTYLDSSPGNDQNVGHFYWDMQIYTASPTSPRPLSLMQEAYAGPNNENVSQAANNWRGRNRNRWVNAEYDAAWEAALVETDPEALANLFITMNDLIVNDINVIPLVVSGPARAASNKLRLENIALAPFSHDYWNIANWNLSDDSEA